MALTGIDLALGLYTHFNPPLPDGTFPPSTLRLSDAVRTYIANELVASFNGTLYETASLMGQLISAFNAVCRWLLITPGGFWERSILDGAARTEEAVAYYWMIDLDMQCLKGRTPEMATTDDGFDPRSISAIVLQDSPGKNSIREQVRAYYTTHRQDNVPTGQELPIFEGAPDNQNPVTAFANTLTQYPFTSTLIQRSSGPQAAIASLNYRFLCTLSLPPEHSPLRGVLRAMLERGWMRMLLLPQANGNAIAPYVSRDSAAARDAVAASFIAQRIAQTKLDSSWAAQLIRQQEAEAHAARGSST